MEGPAPGALSVPLLRGALPPLCQRDLGTLRRLVRSLLSGRRPEAPAPPSALAEVLVTGATGFVGRFLVRDLLCQDPDRIVHCIVRAESAADGHRRLAEKMEEAGVWDDAYRARLRVHAGDLSKARFGLDESAFALLCRRVDAVYHFAADVGLAAPYPALRRINVLSLANVLELSLRSRLKHVFHASTMGVFPEYFCAFAREFRDRSIAHQAMPDLDAMKRVFPPGFVGYPWSKLVAEQAVLFAGHAGLPVGIFRLPQTAISSTGFGQPRDITARIFAAICDVRMVPAGFVFEAGNEAVDALTRIAVDISTNPARRSTIYQCCDPHPAGPDFRLVEFGWNFPEVSYQAFRRACHARGEVSPLAGHWSLLDAFASYWFRGGKARTTVPVDDRAIREDCPRPIHWPGPLSKYVLHYDWIRDHPELWPHPPLPDGRLDYESLVARAREYAEELGVPFERTYPDWMLRALRRYVQALQAPEAGLRGDRNGLVVHDICRLLRNNALWAEERQRFVEINEQEIVRPVFIVGINRTGTTLLHRLLARDPRFRALRAYEYVEPVLPGGDYAAIGGAREDPRRRSAADALRASGLARALTGIHHVDADEPEEDFPILRHCFSAWPSVARYRIPSFEDWLSRNDCRDAYRHHFRVMQHYTFQRNLRDPPSRGHWLFKMPYHLMELGALLETYPDALLIQTHREPARFMGSWASLVYRVRSVTSAPGSKELVGREQLAFMSRMLARAVEFRRSHPGLEERWADVSYFDLVEDPMGAVDRIYERFGWSLTPEAAGAMQVWLEEQRERRRREKRHQYDLAEYGLTREMVDSAFAPYRDFLSKRGHRSPAR